MLRKRVWRTRERANTKGQRGRKREGGTTAFRPSCASPDGRLLAARVRRKDAATCGTCDCEEPITGTHPCPAGSDLPRGPAGDEHGEYDHCGSSSSAEAAALDIWPTARDRHGAARHHALPPPPKIARTKPSGPARPPRHRIRVPLAMALNRAREGACDARDDPPSRTTSPSVGHTTEAHAGARNGREKKGKKAPRRGRATDRSWGR